MARVGTQANAVWLRDIMRQAGAPNPQAMIDELADSLTNRAISPNSEQTGSESHIRAVNALNALIQAGSSAPLKGQPYAGAFDRMITVYRQAPARTMRARALSGMLATSHSRGVKYLSGVAESSDPTAFDAVQFLISDANGGSWSGFRPTPSQQQESISALKALASGKRVTDQRAASLLELWIQRSRSS
jgi:hypothetical protein